jgi:hypothetical protein
VDTPLPVQPVEKLRLIVAYRTPGLNKTKRQHWSDQFREKKKALNALLSALSDTASNPSIRITLPEVSRTCSTACAMLELYLATNRGASGSKPSRKKLAAMLTSGR